MPILGFLIAAPKRHIRAMIDLSLDEIQELFALVYRGRLVQQKLKDLREVTLIQEERSGHFHLWLLPRYPWRDGLFENSLSTVRPMMAYARPNLKTPENVQEILEGVEFLRKEIKKLREDYPAWFHD